MAPQFYATVTCPSCGNQFRTPVTQVLDVRADPQAKNRMLQGAVNVAMCPSCGMGGALNLPFVYHDPEKEAALLYLPAEVGKNEVQRQKAAGKLTQQLMDSLPQEERKGYLLQPETFLSLETMIKRVLEIEGVTEEDMERSQQQRQLIDKLLQAEDEEAWQALLDENEELLDEEFFGMLNYIVKMVSRSQAGAEQMEKIEQLYDFLVSESEAGRRLAERSEAIQGFFDDPNHETLIDALKKAPDDETINALVQSGAELMDYAFFQTFTQRIQEAEGEEEARLKQLRRKILDQREALAEASRQVLNERAKLLESLVETEDPLKMAQSHLSELDDAFFYILQLNLAEAKRNKDQEAFEALQSVAEVVNKVMEGQMPPEMVLLRRLMVAESDEALNQILEQNRRLLSPQFFQFIEMLEQQSREEGEE
ncbi:MAG: hypothetical protein GVY30_09445, partial [Chloroflexi bacterium]|nr:hypothetical protein [Chloroflexota bacterium]